MIRKSKKTQEEMVGFVVVVVLVAVIAMIFLGIIVGRPSSVSKTSKEVETFLHSAMYYTTDCQASPERYYDLQDVIAECYENPGKSCINEVDGETKNMCEVMNLAVERVLNDSWTVGEEGRFRGYVLNMTTDTEEIGSVVRGNKTGTSRGSQIIIPVQAGDEFEKIYVNLDIYY